MTTSTAPSIRSANRNETAVLAGVLAEAFAQYPWTRWAIPAEDYSRRLTELQDLYLRYALDEGVVLVDEQLGGVIALLPPTAAQPSKEFQERVAELHGARFEDVASISLPTAPEEYWSLETLGVHPARQGAGLGRALICAGIGVVAASAQHGVALETSDQRNVLLYERAGFSLSATTSVDDGLMVYSMLHRGPDPTGTVAADDAVEVLHAPAPGGKK